jgi:hypothetical protein
MIRCNVCDKEKEENQFQTYWHSTQQKMRTRKQCNECYYLIRLKRKNPDEYYSNNPDYKKCNTCNEWKLVSEYYRRPNGKIYLHRCKACEIEKERNKYKQIQLENCGGGKVPTKPNKYQNDMQKDCTFELMQILGYLYDTPTGIWIKPGFKEIKDGKPYFPTVISPARKKVFRKLTDDKIKLIEEYSNNGLNPKQIAMKMGLSSTTIYKLLNATES